MRSPPRWVSRFVSTGAATSLGSLGRRLGLRRFEPRNRSAGGGSATAATAVSTSGTTGGGALARTSGRANFGEGGLGPGCGDLGLVQGQGQGVARSIPRIQDRLASAAGGELPGPRGAFRPRGHSDLLDPLARLVLLLPSEASGWLEAGYFHRTRAPRATATREDKALPQDTTRSPARPSHRREERR